MRTTEQLRVSLFGSFRLLRNEIAVSSHDWHTRQARQIFKLLLAERGRFISAQKLLDLLWPEQVEHADKALRSAISALRDVLEPDREPWQPSSFIPRGQRGYMFLSPPHCKIWVDVFEFERRLDVALASANSSEARASLEHALQLYTGEYLAEDGDASWVLSERARLRERYFAGVIRLLQWQGERGCYGEAIELGRHALELDTCREPLYQLVMQYQAYLGDTVAALQTFERCRQVMDDELGIDPSPQTLELHRAILTGTLSRPAMLASTLSARSDNLLRAEARTFPPAVLPLLDRQTELQWLTRYLPEIQIRGNASQALALEGEAGSGKSSLTGLFLHHAQQRHVQTLAVPCQPLEREISFAPLLALLKIWIEQMDSEQLATLPVTTLIWISSLFPEMASRLPLPRRFSFQQPELVYSLLVNEFVAFFAALCARQPLILVLEDIQWADLSTLQVLSRLIHLEAGRQVASHRYPLLLLISYRPEEISEQKHLCTMLRSARRERHLQTLHLNDFTPEEITAYLQVCQIRPLVSVETLAQITRGNALVLSEAVQILLEQQERPVATEEAARELLVGMLCRRATLRELVLGSLEHLPRMAIDLLEIASVIAHPFPLVLLGSHLSLEDCQMLDLLFKRRLLIEDQRSEGELQLALASELFGQILATNCSAVRLAYLHQQIAQRLEHAYALQIELHAEEIAGHYRLAGPGYEFELVYYTLLSAEHARRAFNYRQALAHYETALQLLQHLHKKPEQEEWLEHIARGRSLVYEALLDWQGIQEQQREISLRASTRRDPLLASGSMQRMIVTRSLMGYCTEAGAMGQQFLPLLHRVNEQVATSARPVQESQRLQIDLFSQWAQVLAPQETEEVEAASVSFPMFSFALSPDVPDWESVSASLGESQSACLLTQYGWMLLLQGFLTEAERCLKAAVRAAEATGQITWEILASLHLSRVSHFSGQYQRGGQEFAHCLDLCRRVSEAPWVTVWPLLDQAYYLLSLKRLSEAEQMFLQLREQLSDQDLPAYLYSTQIGLGLIALARQQFSQAHTLLCEVLTRRQNIYIETYVLAEIGLARIAQHQGASTEAYERLRHLLAFSGKRGLFHLYAFSAFALVRLSFPLLRAREMVPLLEHVCQHASSAGFTALASECRVLLGRFAF